MPPPPDTGAKNLLGVLAGGAGPGAKDKLNPNLSMQQKWAEGAGWSPRPVLPPEVSPGKLLGFSFKQSQRNGTNAAGHKRHADQTDGSTCSELGSLAETPSSQDFKLGPIAPLVLTVLEGSLGLGPKSHLGDYILLPV